MLEIRDIEEEGFEGGRYARTEEELHRRAIALLEKCKISAQPAEQQRTETVAEIPPLTV